MAKNSSWLSRTGKNTLAVVGAYTVGKTAWNVYNFYREATEPYDQGKQQRMFQEMLVQQREIETKHSENRNK